MDLNHIIATAAYAPKAEYSAKLGFAFSADISEYVDRTIAICRPTPLPAPPAGESP